MEKIFKIIKRKKDCVLLKRLDSISFKVVDIENDVIYIGKDINMAEKVFDSYDLNLVRKERERSFKKWLKEFAQA